MDRIILDLCGGTGSWSAPYSEAGYDVRLVTLPETDVRDYIPPENVYGILAAPPCTEFSFAKHYHGRGNYSHDFKAGLSCVDACVRLAWRCRRTLKFWALENPKGYLKRWMGEPQFIFDPWEFGDPYQKKTCLWGNFVKPIRVLSKKPNNMIKFSLLKSHEIRPEAVGKFNRQERRAMTPRGFADMFYKSNQ